MITHIVLFTPRRSLSEADALSFARNVLASLRAIPSVSRAVLGPTVTVDPGYDRIICNKTYKFAAVLEFKDEPALRAYLNHPIHQSLGNDFWQKAETAVICEAEVEDINSPAVERLLGLHSPQPGRPPGG